MEGGEIEAFVDGFCSITDSICNDIELQFVIFPGKKADRTIAPLLLLFTEATEIGTQQISHGRRSD